MIRNLLFHLYPKRNSFWRWHVEQLLKFQDVWTGKRLVCVVLDDHTVSSGEVSAALEALDCVTFFRRNNADLGEVAHFIRLLTFLESRDPNEATFYAHGKGVSRDSMLDGIRMWSRSMYELNLTFPELIDRRLETAAAVGAFRVQIPHSGAKWCFAGTFFWLKHSELFSRKWRDIEPSRWGVEGYPGRHLRFEESSGLTTHTMTDRELPEWLYGRNSPGVTETHLKQWMEKLREESKCTRA